MIFFELSFIATIIAGCVTHLCSTTLFKKNTASRRISVYVLFNTRHSAFRMPFA